MASDDEDADDDDAADLVRFSFSPSSLSVPLSLMSIMIVILLISRGKCCIQFAVTLGSLPFYLHSIWLLYAYCARRKCSTVCT